MKPATPLLTVKWTDNAVMLCHPELGVVRMLRDSGGAHYLEEIAAKHNAYPELVAALRMVVQAAHDDKLEDFSRTSNAADAAYSLLAKLGEK